MTITVRTGHEKLYQMAKRYYDTNINGLLAVPSNSEQKEIQIYLKLALQLPAFCEDYMQQLVEEYGVGAVCETETFTKVNVLGRGGQWGWQRWHSLGSPYTRLLNRAYKELTSIKSSRDNFIGYARAVKYIHGKGGDEYIPKGLHSKENDVLNKLRKLEQPKIDENERIKYELENGDTFGVKTGTEDYTTTKGFVAFRCLFN